MKKLILVVLFLPLLIACGSAKKTSVSNSGSAPIHSENTTGTANTIKNIVKIAKTFEGTRYKFGGTTKAGMDCSGLIYRAFKQEDILMPRVSRDMAQKGVSIKLQDVMEGDLIFFKTSKNRVINHVGLVVEANRSEIRFIHSTTSEGVIISSLKESYWKKAFAEIRRVI